MQNSLSQTLQVIASQANPVIEEMLTRAVESKFKEIILYQVRTGGKRLRPALAVLSCQALGGKTADAVYPAAGLEILHNYTLIIDDIIDQGRLRRNQPSLWKKYGKSIAQCVACVYAAAIPESAKNSPQPAQICQILSNTLKQVSQGQVLDILFERNTRLSEPYIAKNRPANISQENYQQMIGLKTASLFSASCHIGALCAGPSSPSLPPSLKLRRARRKGEARRGREIQALRDFGFNLGLAFQIKDDLLDVFGNEQVFGKKIGQDIQEKKGGNIALLLALQELNQREGSELKQIIKKPKILAQDIKKASQLISQTKAKEKSLGLARQFIIKAQKALQSIAPKTAPSHPSLSQQQALRHLQSIANFVLSRQR